jgi:hypothetical protein
MSRSDGVYVNIQKGGEANNSSVDCVQEEQARTGICGTDAS